MRIVDNKCLSTMDSPIKYIMGHIQDAIINIAPERTEQFKIEFPNLTIKYVDDGEWICNANSSNTTITISKRVAETAWCLSYCYMTLFQKYCAGNMYTERTVLDFTKDKEAMEAAHLYKWALDNWLAPDNEKQWNLELPHPQIPAPTFYHYLANQLSLCALAFIMHHELAHIKLGHQYTSDHYLNIESEKEADLYAAEWFLNNDGIDKSTFNVRAYGIAIALEMIVARGLYKKDINTIVDHPRPFDRLLYTLQNYISDENHPVWQILVHSFSLHLYNAKVQIPEKEYYSFFECLDDYIDVLSQIE
jgi:hypothetical protein